GAPRHPPEGLARVRLEANDRVASPHDQLLASARGDDDGRAVGRPVFERLPARLARVAVEGDDACFGLAAGTDDEYVVDDERRRAGPIARNAGVEILGQALPPKDIALGRVETQQIPESS